MKHPDVEDDLLSDEQDDPALAAAVAALPREIAPARDLWPEVVAHHARPPARRRWPIVAAAAAAALVASTGTCVFLQRAPSPETAAQADADRAVAELRAALAARHVDPETTAAVEQNLRIIDDAIRDIRTAIRTDPGDGELKRTLADAYRAKVRLVRQTVYLTRNDDRG